MPARINFTPRSLAGLAVPSGKRSIEIGDERVRHLKVEATAAGTMTFWFRAQRDGQRFNQMLGHFPSTTVDEARRRALELKAEVDRGIDPTAARKALKAEPTIAEFFNDTYMAFSKATKRSWSDDQSRYRHWIGPAFSHRKLSTISKREVAEFHVGLKDSLSVASANRVLVLLSALYALACEWDVVASNPCAGVKQFKEHNVRTKFWDEQEVARFLAACDAEPQKTGAAALKLLTFTGLRKSEVLHAKWEDVNLERGELRLVQTKNNDTRVVVLASEAVAVISAQESRGRSPWIFPGADPKRPFVGLPKVFQRVVERAELVGTGLTIHGLRHTFASHMAMRGCSLHVVGQALGHRSLSTSARYAHLGAHTLRAAVDGAASAFRLAQTNATVSQDSEATIDVTEDTATEPETA